MKLTRVAVEGLRLPPGKGELITFDDEIPGFGVRLRKGGSRSWIVQYKIGPKHRRLTLGSTALLDPAKARELACDLLAKVRLGRDPAGEKIKARAGQRALRRLAKPRERAPMAAVDRKLSRRRSTRAAANKLSPDEIVRDVRALIPKCPKRDVEAALNAIAVELDNFHKRKQREAGWRGDMRKLQTALERVLALIPRARRRMPRPELLDTLDALAKWWVTHFKRRLGRREQPRRGAHDKRAAIMPAHDLLIRYGADKSLLPRVAALLFADPSAEDAMRWLARPHIAAAVGQTVLTGFDFRHGPSGAVGRGVLSD
jgi:hypothetical protein